MYKIYEQLLKERNLKSSDVSKATGISPQIFTNWKRKGTGCLNAENMQKLTDFFNLPADYFYATKRKPKIIFTDDKPKAKDYSELFVPKPKYYTEETSEMAQEIYENKELKLLFDAARDADPEDLKTVHSMLLALKRKEFPND